MGGQAFHLSTLMVALWHCPFPTRDPHTHMHTHIQSCILLSRAHFSLATDKLGCTISCSKLSTAKRAPVSSVAVFEEKWIRVAKHLVMTLYSHQNSMITTQCIY